MVLVWSACLVVIKASQASAPPLLCGAPRAWRGGVLLLAVAALMGKLWPPPGSWRWIAFLGVMNPTVGFSGMFMSVETAEGVLA